MLVELNGDPHTIRFAFVSITRTQTDQFRERIPLGKRYRYRFDINDHSQSGIGATRRIFSIEAINPLRLDVTAADFKHVRRLF
jgi:hypothetical protein